MAPEATRMAVRGNMHIDSIAMEVIEHRMPISQSLCHRRTKGPLPSGYLRVRIPKSFTKLAREGSVPQVDEKLLLCSSSLVRGTGLASCPTSKSKQNR